jgi:hypothetical protein
VSIISVEILKVTLVMIGLNFTLAEFTNLICFFKYLFFFSDLRGKELSSDLVLQLLGDGNESEVEGLNDEDDLILQRPCSPAPPSAPSPTPASRPPPQPRRRNEPRAVVRRRLWKQVSFNQKGHDYPQRQPCAVRSPLLYFQDYFDTDFFEQCARCTNNYYMRKNGRILNTNTVEIKKLIGIHLIMGCIPYPRLYMYWRDDLRLEKVANVWPCQKKV